MIFKGFLNSLRYAFWGIAHCVRFERNFRIQLTAGAYVLALAALMELDRLRFALLFVTIGIVLSLEMLNSAVEALVDLVCPQQHPFAKAAKDICAGTVLVFSLASAGVGICLLWQPAQLLVLLRRAMDMPYVWPVVAILIAMSVHFIFSGKGRKEKALTQQKETP